MTRTYTEAEARARERFWAKVKKGSPDECWPWIGYIGPSGHGRTFHKGTPTLASRKAWVLTHGEPLGGLCVNHKCDHAACCNPAHMYLGTRIDNMVDRWRSPPPNERRKRGIDGSVFTPDELTRMYQMRKEGASLLECARVFKVHIGTICRLVRNQREARLAQLRQDVQRQRDDVQVLRVAASK